jgi:hypothetical protein
MVDFLTLTANSNVSRLDMFDFSDFFDFQADVPPRINDLRNPGFGLWFALSLSKGKRTRPLPLQDRQGNLADRLGPGPRV